MLIHACIYQYFVPVYVTRNKSSNTMTHFMSVHMYWASVHKKIRPRPTLRYNRVIIIFGMHVIHILYYLTCVHYVHTHMMIISTLVHLTRCVCIAQK